MPHRLFDTDLGKLTAVLGGSIFATYAAWNTILQAMTNTEIAIKVFIFLLSAFGGGAVGKFAGELTGDLYRYMKKRMRMNKRMRNKRRAARALEKLKE